jgi:hypothetical protein
MKVKNLQCGWSVGMGDAVSIKVRKIALSRPALNLVHRYRNLRVNTRGQREPRLEMDQETQPGRSIAAVFVVSLYSGSDNQARQRAGENRAYKTEGAGHSQWTLESVLLELNSKRNER